MQNRWVGDVGDFGKYGLLRALTGFQPIDSPRMRLGVVWYLVPDEGTAMGGERTYDYLASTGSPAQALRACDGGLVDVLRRFRDSPAKRDIEAIGRSGILGPKTRFYRDGVPTDALRERWFDGALSRVRICNLVFLDPDNGILQTGAQTDATHKYALPAEVERLVAQKKSVIVYHHLNRQRNAEDQGRAVSESVRRLPGVGAVYILRYRRWVGRLFLVIPSRKDESLLKRRIEGFLDTWGRGPAGRPHFEVTQVR